VYISRALGFRYVFAGGSTRYQVSSIPLSFKYRPIVPVIKIYGIYTHTELNRNWDAMGQQLAGKGEEYRRRSDLFSSQRERWLTYFAVCNSCIVRNPVHAGSEIYLPACFPQEGLQGDAKPAPPVLTDGDMGEVCLHICIFRSWFTYPYSYIPSLCTQIHYFFPTNQSKVLNSLEKYVTFSQVYLLPTPLHQVLITLCRHFYSVRMFLCAMMTIYFNTCHDRFDCKPRCATRVRTGVSILCIPTSVY